MCAYLSIYLYVYINMHEWRILPLVGFGIFFCHSEVSFSRQVRFAVWKKDWEGGGWIILQKMDDDGFFFKINIYIYTPNITISYATHECWRMMENPNSPNMSRFGRMDVGCGILWKSSGSPKSLKFRISRLIVKNMLKHVNICPTQRCVFYGFCLYKRLRFRKDAGDDAGAPTSEQEQQRPPGRPNFTWLVVWNINFMTFHSVGNNDPKWLSYFSEG